MLLEILFVIGLLALVAVFIYTLYQEHRRIEEMKEYTAVTESMVEAFEQAKNAVNVNAGTIRSVQGFVERQSHAVDVLSAIIDVHSRVLSMADLRIKLETDILSKLPTETMDDDDTEVEPHEH